MLQQDVSSFAEHHTVQTRLDDFYMSRIGIRMVGTRVAVHFYDTISSFLILTPTLKLIRTIPITISSTLLLISIYFLTIPLFSISILLVITVSSHYLSYTVLLQLESLLFLFLFLLLFIAFLL